MHAMEPTAIHLVLLNGDSDGVVYAEMQDWAGLVGIFPRDNIQTLITSKDFQCPGVYILVGEDQQNSVRTHVYVGETEVLSDRIRQHLTAKDKTFWKRVIVLKSLSGSLNKAHIKSLESRILKEIDEAKSVEIVNHTKFPAEPHLALHDRISVERFLLRFKVILKSLGFDFFSLKHSLGFSGIEDNPPTVLDYNNPIFELKSVGISALGRMVGDKFIVARGSTLRYLPDSLYAFYADQLISSNLIEYVENGKYICVRDIAFTSPSIAASILAGNQRSGWTAWKVLSTKITMREWSNNIDKMFGFDLSHPQFEEEGSEYGHSIPYSDIGS